MNVLNLLFIMNWKSIVYHFNENKSLNELNLNQWIILQNFKSSKKCPNMSFWT